MQNCIIIKKRCTICWQCESIWIATNKWFMRKDCIVHIFIWTYVRFLFWKTQLIIRNISFPFYLQFSPYSYFDTLYFKIFKTREIFRYLTTPLSSLLHQCTYDLYIMVRTPLFQEYSFLVKYSFRYVFLENKKYELLHKVFYESYHMLARFSLNMINDVHFLRFLHPFFK